MPTNRPRAASMPHSAQASRTTSVCSRSRSEEHTSELQSLRHLVCRLLLEKKKKDATLRPQVYFGPIKKQLNSEEKRFQRERNNRCERPRSVLIITVTQTVLNSEIARAIE